jgi:hypothetical protein
MIQKINAPISVNLVFNHQRRQVYPLSLIWDGRQYPVVKIGLHHTFRLGRTLFHVFSVASNSLFFRLVFDTDTLFWRLEQISDGLPD